MKKLLGNITEKIGLKKQILNIYFFSGKQLEIAKHFFRKIIITQLSRYRKRSGVFAIDIRNDHGIGSKLTWCVVLLKYCEDHNLQPQFRFSYFKSKADFFSTYFSLNVPISTGKATKFTVIHLIEELTFIGNLGNEMSFEEGSRILLKYLRINPEIQTEVSDFYKTYFGNTKVLGIHYRGTDKEGEAPSVSYSRVKKNIEYAIQNYINADSIFLSTDDQGFANFLTEQIKNIPVIMRQDYKRSSDNSPVHLNKSLNKQEINRDAVVNCLILSKCSFLLKTSSFLSDISKLINPHLPTVILNKPYERALWFPTKEILKEMAFQPVE